MIKRIFFPGLLETGVVNDELMVIRDGIVNFYVMKSSDGLICIDSGWRRKTITAALTGFGFSVKDVAAIFLTHLHWDHAGSSTVYPNAEFYAGADTIKSFFNAVGKSTTRLFDGQIVSNGNFRIRSIATPGHTADSFCFMVNDRWLFSGDTLRIGKNAVAPFWHLRGAKRKQMENSIRRLAQFDTAELLLTAHTGMTDNPKAAFRNLRGNIIPGLAEQA